MCLSKLALPRKSFPQMSQIVLFSLFIHIDSRNNNRNNNQYSNMIFNMGFPEETCSTNATFESLVLFMNLCYMLFLVTLITKHLATNVTLMIRYFFMYYLNVPKQAGLTAKVSHTNVTFHSVFYSYFMRVDLSYGLARPAGQPYGPLIHIVVIVGAQ